MAQPTNQQSRKYFRSITEALTELELINANLLKLDVGDNKKLKEQLLTINTEIREVIEGIHRLIEYYAFSYKGSSYRKYYRGRKYGRKE